MTHKPPTFPRGLVTSYLRTRYRSISELHVLTGRSVRYCARVIEKAKRAGLVRERWYQGRGACYKAVRAETADKRRKTRQLPLF